MFWPLPPATVCQLGEHWNPGIHGRLRRAARHIVIACAAVSLSVLVAPVARGDEPPAQEEEVPARTGSADLLVRPILGVGFGVLRLRRSVGCATWAPREPHPASIVTQRRWHWRKGIRFGRGAWRLGRCPRRCPGSIRRAWVRKPDLRFPPRQSCAFDHGLASRGRAHLRRAAGTRADHPQLVGGASFEQPPSYAVPGRSDRSSRSHRIARNLAVALLQGHDHRHLSGTPTGEADILVAGCAACARAAHPRSSRELARGARESPGDGSARSFAASIIGTYPFAIPERAASSRTLSPAAVRSDRRLSANR